MPAMASYLAPPHQGMEAMVATNETSPVSRTIEMDSPSTAHQVLDVEGLDPDEVLYQLYAGGVPVDHGPGRARSYQCQASSAQAKDPRW